MRPEDLTQDNIDFLKRLNQLLSKKEVELLNRSKALAENYEKRLVKNGGDLTDYNIAIYIDFNIGRHHTRFTFNDDFYLNTWSQIEEYKNLDVNWAEGINFPDLGERWCYPMHSLWSHIENVRSRADIFRINNIWFEIRVDEQQEVKFGVHEMIS